MRRLASISSAWAVAALAVIGASGQAQEPSSSGAMAPRTDLNTLFTDAYYNSQVLCPPEYASESESGQYLQSQLWKNPRLYRFYAGSDVLTYHRTKPAREILTRTTINIFRPQNLGPLAIGHLDADAMMRGLYGVNTSGDPNDPFLQMLVVPEFLEPNAIRTTTDDFDNGWQLGIRPKIGIELPSGNRVEFSYGWWTDFESPQVVDLVSDPDPLGVGPAFLMFQITDTDSPTLAHFYRFGYVNARFLTGDPRFRGEARRSNSPDAVEVPPDGPGPIPPGFFSLGPHYPPFENPPIPGPLHSSAVNNGVRSIDIPREPTNGDTDDGPNVQNFPIEIFGSLLWVDGELALADYSYDLQMGELMYKRRIHQFNQRDWILDLLLGVKVVKMDEMFSFFFADTTYDRALANPFWAGPTSGSFASQPLGEVTANYIASVDNTLYGPMIGLDARLPFYSCFEFDLMGKGGWVVNSLRNHMQTYRGDGVVLFDYEKQVDATGGILESRLAINFYPLKSKSVRIHGGYEFLLLVNVGTAVGNIDFDLNSFRRPSHEENVLFHGAFGGLEITF